MCINFLKIDATKYENQQKLLSILIISSNYSFIKLLFILYHWPGFSDSSVGKEFSCNAEDPGSTPGLGRSADKEIGSLLQYS